MLDVWYAGQKAKGRILGYSWSVETDDNFSGDLYSEIDDLNPCEIFYQNVNNYIQEKESEVKNDKSKYKLCLLG